MLLILFYIFYLRTLDPLRLRFSILLYPLNSTMSMITAIAWVPRGFAARFPTKYEVDKHELELIKLRLDDAKDELEDAKMSEKGEKGESVIENDTKAEENSVKIKKADGWA